MTLRVLDSMWSVTKRHASRFPKSISRSIATILFAAVLVLGISVFESTNAPAGFVNAQNPGICDRTLEVQTEIILRILGNPTCDLVTDAQLNAFTGSSGRLLLGNKGIPSLKVGDFAGLTSIREIHVNHNSFTELPSGLFDGLASLEDLRLQSNQLTVLPQGVFSSLADSPNLDTLRLENNEISTIETGAFEGVTFSATATSRPLYLYGNKLSTLQPGAFDGLSNVTWLRLDDNEISTIEGGVFDGFTTLTSLSLDHNQLVELPADVFEDTTALATLRLGNNKLRSLDEDTFRTLTVLATLELHDNELSELPAGIFVNEYPNDVKQHMNKLVTLLLQGNRLSSLPNGIFSDLSTDGGSVESGFPKLATLDLGGNELSNLPIELFPLHRQLCTLAVFDIGDNNFQAAPTREIGGVAYGLFDAIDTAGDYCSTDPDRANLIILTISGLPLVDADLVKIRANHGYLERVNIAGTGVSADAVRKFIADTASHQISTSRVLRELDVSDLDLSSWTSADIQTLTSVVDLIAPLVLRMANTRIDAEQVLLILENLDDYDLTLDFSDNDLSGLNNAAARASLATALRALTKLNHLFLENTEIDGDTARVVLQNAGVVISRGNPVSTIISISFAGNDLSGWNDPAIADDLAAAFEIILPNLWRFFDLSDTGIDDTGAQSIVPNLARTRFWLDTPDTRTVLDLSDNDLTKFESAWIEDWAFLTELDLSNNLISSVSPETFTQVADYLQTLHLHGNPLDVVPDEETFFASMPRLTNISLPQRPDPVETTRAATLSSLAFDGFTLDQVFSPDRVRYTAELATDTRTTGIMAVPEHANDSVSFKLDGTSVSGDMLSLIGNGPFVITIKVIPDPGSTRRSREYDVVLSRSGGPRVVQADVQTGQQQVPIDIEDTGQDTVVQVEIQSLEQDSTTVLVYDAFIYLGASDVREQGCEGAGFGRNVPYTDPLALTIASTCPPGNYSIDIRIYEPSDQVSVDADTPSGRRIWEQVLLRIVDFAFADYSAAVAEAQSDTRVLLAHGLLDFTVPDHGVPSGPPSNRILRIEPGIESVTLKAGVKVRLGIDIYGRQDILDNGLASEATFRWRDGAAGGSFEGEGRYVTYTPPNRPGSHTVTARIACFGDDEQCSAEFKITVLRSSAAVAPTPVPVNPAGTIPSILTDPDGNQYEVFTPEGGGTFTGDTSSLNAGSGVVPNGEIVGLRIAEGGSASNEGKTYQRYTLGGNWYEISAVDASNTSVSSYGLNDAVEVCIPLPNELRSNISGLSIVAISADETLTVLSSRVRISTDAGANVCGGISSVPATVAVGTAGSPAPLPTAVPEEVSDLPDTGGAAPPNDGMIWALIIGLVVLVTSTTAISIRRIRIRSGRTWTR